jgi:hypothetical protein
MPNCYISLQQRLANDEVLVVSIYYWGKVYRESLGMTVDATIVTGNTFKSAIITQSLILKMLKVI